MTREFSNFQPDIKARDLKYIIFCITVHSSYASNKYTWWLFNIKCILHYLHKFNQTNVKKSWQAETHLQSKVQLTPSVWLRSSCKRWDSIRLRWAATPSHWSRSFSKPRELPPSRTPGSGPRDSRLDRHSTWRETRAGPWGRDFRSRGSPGSKDRWQQDRCVGGQRSRTALAFLKSEILTGI